MAFWSEIIVPQISYKSPLYVSKNAWTSAAIGYISSRYVRNSTANLQENNFILFTNFKWKIHVVFWLQDYVRVLILGLDSHPNRFLARYIFLSDVQYLFTVGNDFTCAYFKRQNCAKESYAVELATWESNSAFLVYCVFNLVLSRRKDLPILLWNIAKNSIKACSLHGFYYIVNKYGTHLSTQHLVKCQLCLLDGAFPFDSRLLL